MYVTICSPITLPTCSHIRATEQGSEFLISLPRALVLQSADFSSCARGREQRHSVDVTITQKDPRATVAPAQRPALNLNRKQMDEAATFVSTCSCFLRRITVTITLNCCWLCVHALGLYCSMVIMLQCVSCHFRETVMDSFLLGVIKQCAALLFSVLHDMCNTTNSTPSTKTGKTSNVHKHLTTQHATQAFDMLQKWRRLSKQSQ